MGNKIIYYIIVGIAMGITCFILNAKYFQEPYPISLWIIGIINWLFVLILLICVIFAFREYSYGGSHKLQNGKSK